jgi:hypothetical protein
MVLLIYEVNLCVQLLNNLLIVLLEILHGEFFVILSTLVKLAKSKNF